MNPVERMTNYLKTAGVRKCDIENTIKRIQEKIEQTEAGTPEMATLGSQLEQALKNKKLYKESRSFGLKPDTVAIVATVALIMFYGFSLDLESPRALKIANIGTGLLPKLRIF